MRSDSQQTRSVDSATDGLSCALASYSSNLQFDDIPEDVRTVVKHCVLDWLGVTLAGSREDAGRIVREEALEQKGIHTASPLHRAWITFCE